MRPLKLQPGTSSVQHREHIETATAFVSYRDIYVGNQTGGQQRKVSTQLTDPMRRRHLFHASPAVPVSCPHLSCQVLACQQVKAFWSKIAFAAVHKWFIRCPAIVSATVALLCAMIGQLQLSCVLLRSLL